MAMETAPARNIPTNPSTIFGRYLAASVLNHNNQIPAKTGSVLTVNRARKGDNELV